MERERTLMVRAEDRNTFMGPRCPSRARAWARKNGAALCVRAAGTATLYYMDGGRMRQKSWARISFAPPMCEAGCGRAGIVERDCGGGTAWWCAECDAIGQADSVAAGDAPAE